MEIKEIEVSDSSCNPAFYLNLVPGPDTRLQIDVRLVLFRSLQARSGEVEIRVRTVLGGVIPPDLIVGSAIGGSEVDTRSVHRPATETRSQ